MFWDSLGSLFICFYPSSKFLGKKLNEQVLFQCYLIRKNVFANVSQNIYRENQLLFQCFKGISTLMFNFEMTYCSQY